MTTGRINQIAIFDWRVGKRQSLFSTRLAHCAHAERVLQRHEKCFSELRCGRILFTHSSAAVADRATLARCARPCGDLPSSFSYPFQRSPQKRERVNDVKSKPDLYRGCTTVRGEPPPSRAFLVKEMRLSAGPFPAHSFEVQ